MATIDLQVPHPITTEFIGDILEKEYQDKDPNTHIAYFYVRLGNELVEHIGEEKMAKILKDTLKEAISRLSKRPRQDEVKIWRPYEQGWDAQVILLIKFDVDSKNEREREDMLNEEVRIPLIKKLKTYVDDNQLPCQTPVHIMFSRACLYKNSEGDTQTKPNKISTDTIGKILKTKYGDIQVEDTMIDYFYLFVQAERGKKAIKIHMQELALPILREQNIGDWKIVESEKTWRGMFCGYYPKSHGFITERERERELNEKVAQSLRTNLPEKIKEESEDDSRVDVHVIITRACEYNPASNMD